MMEEEIKRSIEDAIESGYWHLALAIIKRAIRDAKPSSYTGRYINMAYAVADSSGFAGPRQEVQAFFASEGFLWLLQMIGIEPRDLEDIAGRIVMQAFGIGGSARPEVVG